MVLLRYYRRNYCSSSSHRFICCNSREPEYAGNIQSSLDASSLHKTADKSPTIMIFEIDFVFSHLLHMPSFLDYIIKLNDKDQTRFELDGHPIPIEYENLTKAYKLRAK